MVHKDGKKHRIVLSFKIRKGLCEVNNFLKELFSSKLKNIKPSTSLSLAEHDKMSSCQPRVIGPIQILCLFVFGFGFWFF